MSPPAGLSSCRKLYVWAPSVTPDTVLDWASNFGHARVESAKVVNSRRVNIESLRLALSVGAFVSQRTGRVGRVGFVGRVGKRPPLRSSRSLRSLHCSSCQKCLDHHTEALTVIHEEQLIGARAAPQVRDVGFGALFLGRCGARVFSRELILASWREA